MKKKQFFLLFASFSLLLLFTTFTSLAMEEERFYWQYDASGPIQKVVAIDVDQDRFSEFVVVAESNRLELVRSDGTPLWTMPIIVSDTIRAVVGLRTRSMTASAESSLRQSILVGTTEDLILYNGLGEQIWQYALGKGVEIEMLQPIEIDGDAQDELLLLHTDGKLSLLTFPNENSYQVAWTTSVQASADATHLLQLIKLPQNEEMGLIFANATPDQSFISRIDSRSGKVLWRVAWEEEEITQITPYAQGIAVGTKQGRVHLLSADGSPLWLPRTLNKPIVALSSINWRADDSYLLVATESGKWVAYRKDGTRVWDKAICFENDQWLLKNIRCTELAKSSVLEILPFVNLEDRADQLPHYGILVGSEQSARLLLFDANHELSADYEALPTPNVSQWVDINDDAVSELLVARFGTIGLLSSGTLYRSAVETWSYRLGTVPQEVIFRDVSQDGTNELFIGGGQSVHSLDTTLGAPRWVTRLDGDVSHLLLLDPSEEFTPISSSPAIAQSISPPISSQQPAPHLIVAYNQTETTANGSSQPIGRLALLNTSDGSRSTTFDEAIVNGHVTALLLVRENFFNYTLYVGTSLGVVYSYTITPLLTVQPPGWKQSYLPNIQVDGAVERIIDLYQSGVRRLFGATPYDIHELKFMEHTTGPADLIFDDDLNGNLCRIPSDLFFFLEHDVNPTARCFHQSIGTWRSVFGTVSRLRRFESNNYQWVPLTTREWERTNLADKSQKKIYSEVLATFGGDFTGDGWQDFAIGTRDGLLELDLDRGIKQLNYGSSVVKIAGTDNDKSADLVVITANSVVHFLRFAPDYPPLLTSLQVETESDQYRFNVQLLDIEQNPINLGLRSVPDDDKIGEDLTTQFNINQLSWVLEYDELPNAVNYQLYYQDGEQESVLFPRQLPMRPRFHWDTYLREGAPILLPIILVAAGFFIFRYQTQSSTQAKRLFSRLERTPQTLLVDMRKKYDQEDSAEWLLHLTNLGRRKNQGAIAGLANGLFFLSDQPTAGTILIHSTLDNFAKEAENQKWERYAEWHGLFSISQKLLEAPDITQLSVLQTELNQLLEFCAETQFSTMPFSTLSLVLRDLGESEQSDQVDVRLVHLNEAYNTLRTLRNDVHYQQKRLNYVLANALVNRWSGLINAEIESLRGRANLEVKLQNPKIIPSSASRLALELFNSGRSSAENIVIRLQEGDAKPINGMVQEIPTLAPRRSIQVTFAIQPPEMDDFRVVFSIQFDDRQRTGKQFEYANLVSVITPATAFKSVPNPYAPGTPLQKDSEMFFGRKELFQFIAEQAPRLAQQRVLIMVGQRRTGKTSALLRLSRHLPENLIPIYIDCQSLGALPGEAALFQDIAWLVEDTLMARGIDFISPPLDPEVANPLNWFKREFIPAVRQTVSADATLVLVFDEFEAFENLVDDNILPRTLFHHLRHLMQHCEGVCFVFVGTHLLEQMSADYWSVLFNIALYKEIEYLDETSARALIIQPVAPAIRYDELALAHIWHITAGHPYFLQLVCYSLIKHANNTRTSYLTISDVNATVDEMLALGEVHFAYIWQQSNSAEKIVLLAVAHLINRDNPFKTADIINAITPYGIRLTASVITSALNSLVQHNIIREINRSGVILYELKIGIVGSWIERTKSLSTLYTLSS